MIDKDKLIEKLEHYAACAEVNLLEAEVNGHHRSMTEYRTKKSTYLLIANMVRKGEFDYAPPAESKEEHE